jgi:hypothetical protein
MSYRVIGTNGPPCPGCGRPTQVREHDRIRPKHLRQPYYFKRWFCCQHEDCPTTLYMREEFKVWNKNALAQTTMRIRGKMMP